jgi:hypothetical protein
MNIEKPRSQNDGSTSVAAEPASAQRVQHRERKDIDQHAALEQSGISSREEHRQTSAATAVGKRGGSQHGACDEADPGRQCGIAIESRRTRRALLAVVMTIGLDQQVDNVHGWGTQAGHKNIDTARNVID